MDRDSTKLLDLDGPPPGDSLRLGDPLRHGRFEDFYALFVGTVLVSLGLVLLQGAGIVTGGVAGLALLAAYLTGWPVGLFFVALTLPMLALTARAMGRAFVIKTSLVVTGILLFTLLAPRAIRITSIDPAFAAIVGGSIVGMGALALARHGAGAGGTGAIILWLYRERGWNAGRTQMALDGIVLLLSLVKMSPVQFGWSLLSVVFMAGVLWMWHRPGRYTGY